MNLKLIVLTVLTSSCMPILGVTVSFMVNCANFNPEYATTLFVEVFAGKESADKRIATLRCDSPMYIDTNQYHKIKFKHLGKSSTEFDLTQVTIPTSFLVIAEPFSKGGGVYVSQ